MLTLEKPRKRLKGGNTKRQSAIKRADRAFSKFIRLRDGYTCFTCGKDSASSVAIECGHLITVGRMPTRWDPLNAHAQCNQCNCTHEMYPERYTRKWIERHGVEAYDDMVKRSWIPCDYSTYEIIEFAKEFEARVKEMEDEISYE